MKSNFASSSDKDKNNSKQKTALKLANQYAESYKLIEKENKGLCNEIQDLKTSLQINKTMISDLLSSMKPAQKEKAVIDGLRKEILVLNKSVEFYKKENSELKQCSESSINTSELFISKYQKQIDSLSSKVFLLENTVIKKENMIKQLNKKIDDSLFYKEIDGNIYVRETYVSTFLLILIYIYIYIYMQLIVP